MTTGKFFKAEQCAHMITTEYDILVITRPDLLYNGHTTIRDYLVESPTFFRNIGDELFVTSFTGGHALALNYTQAECCDLKMRSPRDCFISGHPEPRANFIANRHFSSSLPTFPYPKRPYIILRTDDQISEMAGRKAFQLHGKTKHGVPVSATPNMSPPFFSWYSLSPDEQLRLVTAYLPPVSTPESLHRHSVTNVVASSPGLTNHSRV